MEQNHDRSRVSPRPQVLSVKRRAGSDAAEWGSLPPQTAPHAWKQTHRMASCKVSMRRLRKRQMFSSSRNLCKAILCIGKELSSVMNSTGKSRRKPAGVTVGKELSCQAPRSRPLIPPDRVSSYVTRAKTVFCGDGVKETPRGWQPTRSTLKEARPPTKTHLGLGQPPACIQ